MNLRRKNIFSSPECFTPSSTMSCSSCDISKPSLPSPPFEDDDTTADAEYVLGNRDLKAASNLSGLTTVIWLAEADRHCSFLAAFEAKSECKIKKTNIEMIL